MKHFQLIPILTLVAVALAAPTEDEEVPADVSARNLIPKLPEEELKGTVTCVNATLSFTPEFKENVLACIDPQIWGTEEGKKNPNCKFFCQSHAVGTLNEHDLPTEELYSTYIDLAFPEDARAKAKEHLKECLETLGSKVDPKDPECEGAAEFNVCIFKAFQINC